MVVSSRTSLTSLFRGSDLVERFTVIDLSLEHDGSNIPFLQISCKTSATS